MSPPVLLELSMPTFHSISAVLNLQDTSPPLPDDSNLGIILPLPVQFIAWLVELPSLIFSVLVKVPIDVILGCAAVPRVPVIAPVAFNVPSTSSL